MEPEDSFCVHKSTPLAPILSHTNPIKYLFLVITANL
jgi:hypothetical protein